MDINILANNTHVIQNQRKVIKNMRQKYKPGEKAPSSCDYKVISANGKEIARDITVDAGESFPPTPEKNQFYIEQ